MEINQKSEFSVNQHLLIELLQTSPIFVVCLVLHQSHCGILTLFCFHLFSMITLPLLFCKIYKVNLYHELLQHFKTKLKVQTLIGSILGAVIMIGMMIAFILYVELFSWEKILAARIPLQWNTSYLMMFSVVFSSINPIFEEFFWRLFLGSILPKDQKTKWNISVHYGLYHFFVVDYILKDHLIALALTVIIIILGRILHYLKDHFGLISAIITHVGVDSGVCGIVYIIYGYHIDSINSI